MFVTLFGIWYVFSPRFCHRFVGYLEEEAVKTYTKCLEVTVATALFKGEPNRASIMGPIDSIEI